MLCEVWYNCMGCCRRAGLYKQMAELKALVSEYRENPPANAALKVCFHASPSACGMHNTMIAAVPQKSIQGCCKEQITVPSIASSQVLISCRIQSGPN